MATEDFPAHPKPMPTMGSKTSEKHSFSTKWFCRSVCYLHRWRHHINFHFYRGICSLSAFNKKLCLILKGWDHTSHFLGGGGSWGGIKEVLSSYFGLCVVDKHQCCTYTKQIISKKNCTKPFFLITRNCERNLLALNKPRIRLKHTHNFKFKISNPTLFYFEKNNKISYLYKFQKTFKCNS